MSAICDKLLELSMLSSAARQKSRFFYIKQMRNKLNLTKRNNKSNKLAANANSTQTIFTATYLHAVDQTLL